jgi:hypothetical protein
MSSVAAVLVGTKHRLGLLVVDLVVDDEVHSGPLPIHHLVRPTRASVLRSLVRFSMQTLSVNEILL